MSARPSHRFHALSSWIIAALGFSIPLSTAAANFLMLAVLIVWMVLPGRVERIRLFRDNPVARMALLLFLALALGCLWGEASWEERLQTLLKYLDLIFIGMIVGLLSQPQQIERAMLGFGAGMATLLLLSVAIWVGLLPEGDYGVGSGAVVMKHSITHNWLMAFFAFFCMVQGSQARHTGWRYGFYLVALLASLNVLFMVGGRTGYLLLVILMAYGCWLWKGWRGLTLAVAVLGLVGVISLGSSGLVADRIEEGLNEVRAWNPGEGDKTSLGFRLDWYRASIELIAQRPLLGVGTGSFSSAMQAHLAGSAIVPPTNPHNEYLLMMVQIGIVGLALLLALFTVTWRSAAKLLPPERYLLRATVLAMASGCLFNSFFLDFTEGIFFAWMVGVLASHLRPREGLLR